MLVAVEIVLIVSLVVVMTGQTMNSMRDVQGFVGLVKMAPALLLQLVVILGRIVELQVVTQENVMIPGPVRHILVRPARNVLMVVQVVK